MRIACIAKGHHPAISGGVESFERNLLEIFKDEEIMIFSYKSKHKKIFEVDNVVEIDNSKNLIDKIILKILGRKRVLKLRVKNWKPDVIILNTPNDLKFLKDIKAKKILVQHGSFEYYLNGTFNKPKIVELIRKKIDGYVFLSEPDKIKFNEYLKLDDKKVKAIRHASSIEILKNKKKLQKKIIVLSRLEKNKRIDLIVTAMKKLEDFELDIYGGGIEEEKLKRIVKDLNLSNVKLLGITTEIVKALDSCSIFVMVSNFEGYPISCIEALRRGLPIILRNTFHSARDIVEENGVLLSKEWNEDKFVEAVKKIYENYDYYSENSTKLGQRYNINLVKEKWYDLIRNL